MDSLPHLTEEFAGLRVLVVGDAMLDCYLHGSAERLCPEAPVPVVDVEGVVAAPGGAANTAVNVAALGARVSLLSLLGSDAVAEELSSALSAGGVDASPSLVVPGRPTMAKRRVMSGGQVLLRIDEGDGSEPDARTRQRLISSLADAFAGHDAVIVSDYAYGTLPPEVIAALAGLQRRAQRVLVADSKHLTAFRAARPTAVKPNYAGAMRLLGEETAVTDTRAEALVQRGERILALTGARVAAVTLDADGAIVFESGRPPYRTYARSFAAGGTAGAGDTYTAAFTLALAAGADTPQAAELAQAAASVAVREPGTTACAGSALRGALGDPGKVARSAREAAARVGDARAAGARIVFTNGCFDILHRGHVTYLSQAKSLGDLLVVGVNSDESVRRLKGPSRPVNPLEDRLHVLQALSCVDVIVPFEEDTPHAIIEAVRPDIFVKGGDYTVEQLPEAALIERLGGEIKLLPYVRDRSTSSLIDRIRDDSAPAEEGA